MSKAQGVGTFLAVLCLSVAVPTAAFAQNASEADAPNAPSVASPETQDTSRPGWLLRGPGQNRIVNPFRATPAPGARMLGPSAPRSTAPVSQLPPNAIPNPSAPGGWSCVTGYRRQGGQCVEVQIPANAMLDFTGRGWKCNPGFALLGQECAPLVVPENASLDASGNRWACNHGYRRQGQGCVTVAVPQNASLDKAGHNWVCNPGYVAREQRCIDEATARLQQQADKAVNARPAAGQAAQRPSVTINSGENRQGRTNKAKVVIGRF